ncbi:hypothetical protein JW851_03660 [Candidatus Woesearchaeota archaeon]|nr:hypothetical protein [Candidatus Woesearchaeota archaeon]
MKQINLLFCLLAISLLIILTACDEQLTDEQIQNYASNLKRLGKAYETEMQKEPQEPSCVDSDYGKNIHDYGYTTETIDGKTIINKDECEGNILYEAMCFSDFVKGIEAIDCAKYNMICSEGKCIIDPKVIEEQQCVDTDEGLNMLEFGYTSEIRDNQIIENRDKCVDNILHEAVCKEGRTKAIERIDCEQFGLICFDGVCVQEPEQVPAADEEPEIPQIPRVPDLRPQLPRPLGGRLPERPAGEVPEGRGGEPEQLAPREPLTPVGPVEPVQTPDEIQRPASIEPRTLATREIKCEDTDGGIKPFVKGVMTNAFGVTQEDTCYTDTKLKEYYCISPYDTTWATRSIDCAEDGRVCKRGMCVSPHMEAEGPPCFETDNGKNPEKMGTTTSLAGEIKSDDCVNARQLREYYCENGELRGEVINCEQGTACYQGACTQYWNIPTNLKQCTDIDNGLHPTIFGITTSKYQDVQLQRETDRCLSHSRTEMAEYYCDPATNEVELRYLDCADIGMSCYRGICVQIAPEPVLQPAAKITKPSIIKEYPILKDITIKKII